MQTYADSEHLRTLHVKLAWNRSLDLGHEELDLSNYIYIISFRIPSECCWKLYNCKHMQLVDRWFDNLKYLVRQLKHMFRQLWFAD